MENLQAVASTIESILVDSIPKMVKEANVKSPRYCLVIHYGWDDWWPPCVLIGAESDRPATNSGTEYDPYDLTCGADFVGLQFEDPELEKLGELLQRFVRSDLSQKGLIPDPPSLPLGDGDDAALVSKAILENVALKLNNYDWKTILPITNDFRVVADTEATFI